jgi:DNA-binding LacI/PurR family transcriptional regulator
MPPPSIRSLARQLGLSAATVSLALRDSPRVVETTRRRVQKAAARAGYRSNPLVGSVLTAVRRASHGEFQGALLAINHWPGPGTPAVHPFHREILAGARRRAAELGCSLTQVWEGPQQLSLARINSMIAARGVAGVIVMPFPETRDFSELSWAQVSGVMLDYCLTTPSLHTVLPDHQATMLTAMHELAARGYRRPGLMIAGWRDARIKHRWSAGYHSACAATFGASPLPVLAEPELDKAAFCDWVRRRRPDVVIAHAQREVRDWLAGLGFGVPADVGFLALNRTEISGPCAALDLMPAQLGVAAAESAVAQMQRNERGVPARPKTIMLAGDFVDGPTLRAAR